MEAPLNSKYKGGGGILKVSCLCEDCMKKKEHNFCPQKLIKTSKRLQECKKCQAMI